VCRRNQVEGHLGENRKDMVNDHESQSAITTLVEAVVERMVIDKDPGVKSARAREQHAHKFPTGTSAAEERTPTNTPGAGKNRMREIKEGPLWVSNESTAEEEIRRNNRRISSWVKKKVGKAWGPMLWGCAKVKDRADHLQDSGGEGDPENGKRGGERGPESYSAGLRAR